MPRPIRGSLFWTISTYVSCTRYSDESNGNPHCPISREKFPQGFEPLPRQESRLVFAQHAGRSGGHRYDRGNGSSGSYAEKRGMAWIGASISGALISLQFWA